MPKLTRTLVGALLCLICAVGTTPVRGQNVPRLTLRKSVLTFDQNIQPIFFPNSVIAPSAQALQITADHTLARQQTILAMEYITMNRNRIQAGQDPFYNQVFGGFYDRSNPFFGTYNVDSSHLTQVAQTYRTALGFMELPTSYNIGGGATLAAIDNSNPIFFFDFGLRHWGFSNSDSRAMMNANSPGAFGAGFGVGGSLRWDADNGQPVGGAAANALIAFANSIDGAFQRERLDIYGVSNNPNIQFVGDVFLNGIARYGGDLKDVLVSIDFDPNGTGAFRFTISPPPWNSGSNVPFQDPNDFSPARLQRWQYIVSSFTEFTTNQSDPRGGAFWGVRDIINILDPSGRSQLFTNSMDAENFSRFIELLNANGFTDPRALPPLGKNGGFSPLVPTTNTALVNLPAGFVPRP